MDGKIPYTDQIWLKSNCREIEKQTYEILKRSIKNKSISIMLVDEIKIQENDKSLIVTDNVLEKKYYLALWPEYWGSFAYTPEYKNVIPKKGFNCFINRTCPIRQSWFYQLVRRDLLNDGWISFLLDYRKTLAPTGLDVLDKIAVYDFVFSQGCDIFVEEHHKMREHVPFQNFDISIDAAIIDSKITLVIETYFDTSTIAFSEKIFRALQLPRPFLLYCAKGSISILRNLGFNVYDDIVDHGYDCQPDNIKRQVEILDRLEKYKNISYNQLKLDDFNNRAAHNQKILRKLRNEWPSKLKKTIEVIESHK